MYIFIIYTSMFVYWIMILYISYTYIFLWRFVRVCLIYATKFVTHMYIYIYMHIYL